MRTVGRCSSVMFVSVFLAHLAVATRAPSTSHEELINTIRVAHEVGGTSLFQGQGTASTRVTTIRELRDGTEEREESTSFCAFEFKSQKTRTDEYAVIDGERGDLRLSFIDTGEVKYGHIAGANAYIMPGGGAELAHYRALGNDFHPETFSIPKRVHLADRLEGLLAMSKEFKPKFRDDGLFEITVAGRRDHESWELSARVVLDPRANYRLVEHHMKVQTDEHGSLTVVDYRVDYDSGFSDVYPKRVVREIFESYHGDSNRRTRNIRIKHDIELLGFDSQTEVPDSDFTFEALNLPVGIFVVDFIRDLSYRYKTPLGGHDGEVLLKLLEEDLGEETSGLLQPGSRARAATTEPPAGLTQKSQTGLMGGSHDQGVEGGQVEKLKRIPPLLLGLPVVALGLVLVSVLYLKRRRAGSRACH